jgi:hypothetical protein
MPITIYEPDMILYNIQLMFSNEFITSIKYNFPNENPNPEFLSLILLQSTDKHNLHNPIPEGKKQRILSSKRH